VVDDVLNDDGVDGNDNGELFNEDDDNDEEDDEIEGKELEERFSSFPTGICSILFSSNSFCKLLFLEVFELVKGVKNAGKTECGVGFF
jgi:hypothetical protein